MQRKTFIKLSSTLMAAPLLSPLNDMVQQGKLSNWAGNLTYSTRNVFYPKSVIEVIELVKKKDMVKGLGTRHCFNTIADTKYNLLSTRDLNNVIEINEKEHTVTVESGIKYGALCPYLQTKGFALHNLASLPHISVAGSVTTATHGSGVNNGNLAKAVRSFEMVIADGSVVHFSRKEQPDKFLGSVVSLGALGIITKVTLDIQPTYMMRQYVFTGLPMKELKDNFEKIMSAGYSVSLFTDWQSEHINEVWIKERTDAPSHASKVFYGAEAAVKNLHPIMDHAAENCTEQMGVPGPWFERLPHFKMGFTPSSGKELQSEYFVPFHHALEAIQAVSRLKGQIGPHLFISEIRAVDADDLWLSPCYKQKSVTIHFTWKQEWEAVRKLLPLIEKELAPFHVKPHWGKLFTIDSKTLAQRYEKMEEFKSLAKYYDAKGKFQNQFLKETVF